MESPADPSSAEPEATPPVPPAKAASTRKRATRTASARTATGAASAKANKAGATSANATSAASPLRRGGSATGSDDRPDHGDRPGGWRWRNRSAYDRTRQRPNEKWPVVGRGLARVLRSPDAVLSLLGTRAPVEVDGRVLNRNVQAMIAALERLGGSASTDDPAAMRTQFRRAARSVMPVRTDVHVAGRTVPGTDGAPDVPVRVYRQFGRGLATGGSGPERLPAIVYFHGGGWVIGDLDSHDAGCRVLAAVSGCLVVAVDYRLAPEHPYPAAVVDSVAAYRWVHAHADELGIAPGRIGVMGDSAGGNLAAVVAQVTRPGAAWAEAATPPPVAQGLIYPVVDAHLDTPSMARLSEGFLLTRESMEYYRAQYLPDRDDWDSGAASPLLAGDLGGLAPALVVTAGFDPLRDDGTNYAGALARAGVEVEYRCYDDQVHGFLGIGILPDSIPLITEVCDAMGRLMRRVDA